MLKEQGDESAFFIQSREEGCKAEWREHQILLVPWFWPYRGEMSQAAAPGAAAEQTPA